MRTFQLGLLAFFSLFIGLYAVVAYGFFPLGHFVAPVMAQVYHFHKLAIYTHIFAALFALVIGPFQFSRRLRQRRPALHRLLGKLYLGIGVLLGGLAGFYMAFYAAGGSWAQLGFASLALCWLFTGFRAYRSIRAGDVRAHEQWMVRNFALTFAAVTLRIMLGLGMGALRLPFEEVYPVIAWACWVPNLLFAEWVLIRPKQSRHQASRRTA